MDKPFLAFSYSCHSACGGSGDEVGRFSTLDEAIAAAKAIPHRDNVEVYDIVAETWHTEQLIGYDERARWQVIT